MEKWEYKIIYLQIKGFVNKKIDPEAENQLNALGNEGWELVGTAAIGGRAGGWGAETSCFAFIFKRAIE